MGAWPPSGAAVLEILSAEDRYAETRGDQVDQEGVTAFVTIDQNNPSSIWNCVYAARENARALRATISAELWECVNSTWLGLRDLDMAGLQARGAREFFDWVKERSHQFRGVAHGTMLHNEAFAFNRIGTFIERGDNTARLLDTKFQLLASETGEGANADPATSYYEWGAVLRAVSAFRAYHQVYKDVITSERVAEMLVLRADMPRSLRFCFDNVTGHLETLSGGRQLECERLGRRIPRTPALWTHGTYSRNRFARVPGRSDESDRVDLGPAFTRFHDDGVGGEPMRVAISHETVYRYATPADYSIQYLRLTPLSGISQRVLNWKLFAPAPLVPWTDAFGNASHVLVMDRSHDEIRVQAVGEVEIADGGKPLLSDGEMHAPELYLRESKLTEADTEVKAFAQKFLSGFSASPRSGLEGVDGRHPRRDRL